MSKCAIVTLSASGEAQTLRRMKVGTQEPEIPAIATPEIRASYLSQALKIELNPRNLHNDFKDRDIPRRSTLVQISGRLYIFLFERRPEI